MKVKLLGVRGTVPVSGYLYDKYGGDTLSIMLEAEGRILLIDGGTGILSAPSVENATVLLTHSHVDHLTGLLVWPPLYHPKAQIDIYAAVHGGLGPKEQLNVLMKPPLWPISTEDLSADISYHVLPHGAVFINGFTVESIEGNHPGGVTVYRISNGSQSVVICTDCELDEETGKHLMTFAKDCDLLLVDGQYRDEEYHVHNGWGHSSEKMAVRFAMGCMAKEVVLIHHAQTADDRELDSRNNQLHQDFPKCRYGRQGEVIQL